eukprot:TRINITY_DN15043_c0_g3_i1.p1 TRINITY_DN15043_c0_g3~~TRINITY_DN15043_c0_g3_i1.p1  ORF type:complete len:715 (-),score=143.59 TRINITY_DN15043_c0_g3_i1:62-2206(-)
MAAATAAGQTYRSVVEAAQASSVDVALAMVEQGFDVNEQDSEGNTALHWACWFRADALLARLLERGARPEICNASGETAAHWAAKASNVYALGATTRGRPGLLSVRDCDGFTPFIICAQIDNGPLMEWMYLEGVNVEEQDDYGRTALQWACYKGHRRTAQWLLSRSASVAHRDHEGMTAIHWAALKGHEHIAEMLLDVGAVGLLSVPDMAGDTPIALAMRKKNRYLVFSFHKSQVLQFLIGRPFLSRNNFANLFLLFMALNCLVFSVVLAPGIASRHATIVVCWALVMLTSLLLWQKNCRADPGWLRPRTIYSQDRHIGEQPAFDFDVEQPIESQMVRCENLSYELATAEEEDESSDLQKLEVRQGRCGYQRQLIHQARRRLDEDRESSACCVVPGFGAGADAGGGGPGRGDGASGLVELEPLMLSAPAGAHVRLPVPKADAENIGSQLDRASLALQERELEISRRVGRARMQTLRDEGCDEYLELLEHGDFKKICVVCRSTRKMRSHHCKECGRCVDRLDHHCPWIDNCVGLGNQRMFYWFLLALFVTILTFYRVVWLYIWESLLPEVSQGSLAGLFHAISNGSLGPELMPISVFVIAAFNLIWLVFVGALVARHTAYISVNLTTYEVLVRPAHVRKRFPKQKGRFWFLGGLGPLSCMRHWFEYWTLSQDGDFIDFPDSGASPAGDDYVAGEGGAVEEDEEFARLDLPSVRGA